MHSSNFEEINCPLKMPHTYLIFLRRDMYISCITKTSVDESLCRGEPHVEVAIWPATSGFRTQYETYDMRELVPKKVSIHKNTTHQALQLDKLWTAYHFDERTAYVTMKSIDTIPRCNTRPIFLKKCIAFLLKCLIFF